MYNLPILLDWGDFENLHRSDLLRDRSIGRIALALILSKQNESLLSCVTSVTKISKNL